MSEEPLLAQSDAGASGEQMPGASSSDLRFPEFQGSLVGGSEATPWLRTGRQHEVHPCWGIRRDYRVAQSRWPGKGGRHFIFVLSVVSVHSGQPPNLRCGSTQNFPLGCSKYPLFIFSLWLFIWLSFIYLLSWRMLYLPNLLFVTVHGLVRAAFVLFLSMSFLASWCSISSRWRHYGWSSLFF